MIDYLEEKLKGELPVNRDDLFELVSSWGRNDDFSTVDEINVYKCNSNMCYPLENLDVSEIKDFSLLFGHSLYTGDLSKWDVSNVENMGCMFWRSNFNNDSLNSWNLSKVKNIDFMFYLSKFNGNVSNWNVSNVINFESCFDKCPFDGDISKWKFNEDVDCFYIFYENYNFENKYNAGNDLPDDTKGFLEWFEENRLKIANLNISKDEILELDDYLISFNQDKETFNIK